MNKSSSRGSVELESPHDGIKAVTQVSIDVADMKEPETGDRGFAKGVGLGSDSSLESLVR